MPREKTEKDIYWEGRRDAFVLAVEARLREQAVTFTSSDDYWRWSFGERVQARVGTTSGARWSMMNHSAQALRLEVKGGSRTLNRQTTKVATDEDMASTADVFVDAIRRVIVERQAIDAHYAKLDRTTRAVNESIEAEKSIAKDAGFNVYATSDGQVNVEATLTPEQFKRFVHNGIASLIEVNS